MKSMIGISILILANSISLACAGNTAYQSSYAGEEKRTIKSLSEDDIRQLKNGKGWGLAKAAELNGMPGPVHILEMKTEISLTDEQEEKIRALFEDMKSKAIPLGNKLVDLEKDLNDSFAKHTITSSQLRQKLGSISKVSMELRYVHLQAHLETPGILTPEQVEKYTHLRGYGSGDPCKTVPQGHNPELWKQHNGCN